MKRYNRFFTLCISILFLLISTSSVLAAGADGKAQIAEEEQAIYRLYNVKNGEHLYTADLNEYQSLSGSPDWNGEDVAWYAPVIGDPVFRLFNKNTSFHLYTMDDTEIGTLLYPCDTPWSPDNAIGNNIYPVFCSGGSKEIYRLYNPGIQGHLLTADPGEYNALAQSGWNAEGAVLRALH